MFSNYNKDHNYLYNKLIEFSRNIYFYKDAKLPDTAETRVLLIFFHFSIILQVYKIKKFGKFPQYIYDNIFQNIEYNLRELGLGDVNVNKKMKNLNKYFYDILMKVNINKNSSNAFEFNKLLFKYYFEHNSQNNEINLEFIRDYFNNFFKICFELKSENMIKGQIKI